MPRDTMTTESRALTDFRGDFDALAKLMERSWSENHASAFLYTANYLESCFAQPGASFALAPTLYHGHDPVGFIAGFPRTIRYKGSSRKILLITLLTVSPEHKKLGYGIVLWSELVKRARQQGFDGMINYCVDGEAMNGMITGCCRRMRLPVERVFTASYLTGLLRPETAVPEAPLDPVTLDRLLAACNHTSESAEVGRHWSIDEVRWLCTREGAIVAEYNADGRWGALTGQTMYLADKDHTKVLMVEDILWETLTAEERTALVKKLMQLGAAAGARIASVPMLGYADMEPFRTARFRLSTRKLHAYLTVWNDDSPPLDKVSSLYLDVF